jgi:hypothetical protein
MITRDIGIKRLEFLAAGFEAQALRPRIRIDLPIKVHGYSSAVPEDLERLKQALPYIEIVAQEASGSPTFLLRASPKTNSA